MTRHRLSRSLRLGVVGAAVALAACADDPDVFQPTPTAGNGLFDRYVALGNSLTAGFQSSGINDSTQRESYAYLMATQSMDTRFAYAALAGRGCAPPVMNIQTQERVGGPGVTGETCDLRAGGSVTGVLNSVAVPGAWSPDPFSTSTATSNALTTFILGGRTQVQAALAADPTFASLWIGNNDVLEAAVSGVITPMPGVSRGATSVADFTASLDATLDPLLAGAPELEGVLLGVVNVTNAPVLFPAAALLNPQFKAGFEQYTGVPVTVLPTCTPTSTSLISFRIISAIRAYAANPAAPGAHPPVISCTKGAFPPSPLVGEVFVLDAAEITTLVQTVAGYNAALQARATELGWAYFDPNPTLVAARQAGNITVVPDLASATLTFGPWMSLDGAHPRRPAHVAVANGVIDAINATYGTTLPAVE